MLSFSYQLSAISYQLLLRDWAHTPFSSFEFIRKNWILYANQIIYQLDRKAW